MGTIEKLKPKLATTFAILFTFSNLILAEPPVVKKGKDRKKNVLISIELTENRDIENFLAKKETQTAADILRHAVENKLNAEEATAGAFSIAVESMPVLKSFCEEIKKKPRKFVAAVVSHLIPKNFEMKDVTLYPSKQSVAISLTEKSDKNERKKKLRDILLTFEQTSIQVNYRLKF